MHDLNVATIFFGAIALAATVGWMIWTLRQAQISRRGPTDDVQSYLRHDKATGAIAMCVAVGGVVIAALIIREQPIPIWPGAIAGVVAIIVCERRWPRPSGSIRTVLLVAPRSSLRLVPWLGVALA
jgi:Na+/H+ antiporter NhaD/arsenite permease-like protein